MKVIVFGARGTLGKEVCNSLNVLGHDICWSTKQCADVTSRYDIHKCVDHFRPNVVINCAGIVKGRDVPDPTYIAVNSLAPHIMAEECDEFGARLIQISTDCVFSGFHPEGFVWTEKHTPCPNDLYGRSKLAGEIDRIPHLTIRTSFIGLGDRGLLAWLLKQKGTVPGYKKALWNGLTAPAVSRIISSLIENDLYGIIHIHGPKIINKYDLLSLLVDYFGLDIKVEEVEPPPEHIVNRCLWSINLRAKATNISPSLEHMVEELADTYSMMQ